MPPPFLLGLFRNSRQILWQFYKACGYLAKHKKLAVNVCKSKFSASKFKPGKAKHTCQQACGSSYFQPTSNFEIWGLKKNK